jgi:hypothetical protein
MHSVIAALVRTGGGPGPDAVARRLHHALVRVPGQDPAPPSHPRVVHLRSRVDPAAVSLVAFVTAPDIAAAVRHVTAAVARVLPEGWALDSCGPLDLPSARPPAGEWEPGEAEGRGNAPAS